MIIKNQLYNETVDLEFESFRHQYKESGVIVPSVTTILSIINKPALVSWAANTAIASVREQITPGVQYDELQLEAIFESSRLAHNKKKTDAGNYGTFVHNWIEGYIAKKNPAMPVNKDLKISIEKFLQWETKNKVKFLVSEQIIFSKKYRYAGKLDCICLINGKLYLIDWKTSSGIYPLEMGAQLGAYKMAREEEFGEKYKGFGVVRIDKKDGSLEMWKTEDTQIFEHTFLYALMLYKQQQRIKEMQQTALFKEGITRL